MFSLKILASASILLGVATGQSDAQDTVIREIVVTNMGPGRIDEALVPAYTVLRAGDALDRQRVAADVRRLLDAGRFADASVRAESLTNGVRLVYTLRNKWTLTQQLELHGTEHFRQSKIREFMGMTTGDLIDEQALNAGTKRVELEYREDFYPDAKVTWKLENVDVTQALVKVSVRIDEGKRAKVRKLVFAGNEGVDDGTLKHVVRPVSWYNPFSWFKRVHYGPQELEESRSLVEKAYRDRGYLDARVRTPAVQRQDDGRVNLVYEIAEGPCYRFQALGVGGSGLQVFPEPELRAQIKARPGDLASEAAIKDNASLLRDYFGSRGYIQTGVRPQLSPNPTQATVRVTYLITEGDLCSIRNIVIRGNTRTRDKVIRRELLVYPGEIYNEVKVRQSERILNNLGYFGSVRSDPVDTRIPDEKDLAYSLEEKRTGQFMIGAGFSSVDDLIGFMEISQGNFDASGWPFTGAGQKVKLRTQFGSTRSEYVASFVEPWFLDRKLSLGVDLYLTDVDYDDYELTRTGAAISLGKALPGPNRVQLQYRIERNDIQNVADTNRYVYEDNPEEEYFFDEDEDTINSSMGLKLTHDTRNSPFVASRGDRVVLGSSLSGGPLGFDTDMTELTFSAAHYQPLWWKHVLSLKTRWEVIEEYGDTDEIPISDRLFIGGGRTIRGFEYRDVGPKVVRTEADGSVVHRPVGGKSLALANAEYAVPLVSALRLATFYDIGNVYRESFEFDLGTLASSVGVGIRFDLPGFPIRIDYAWDLEKDSELTDTDAWTFWIGFE